MAKAAQVLVVDDEAIIRTLVEDGLVSAGYEVELASTAEQAVSLIEADPSTFQALITDVRLGRGPTGWDIARRARELVHDLPVIYMTGDSGGDWSSQGVPESVLLIKPFAVDQVVTAVSTLITQAAARRAV